MTISFSKIEKETFDIVGSNYVVFCHGSYEDRSVFIDGLNISPNMISSFVISYSSDYLESDKYKNNMSTLLGISRNKYGIEPHIIPIVQDNTINYLKLLDNNIGKIVADPGSSLLVDITTFPRNRLLCLFDYLSRKRKPLCKVEFIYAHAKKFNSQEINGWLTRGVGSIKSVPGFNGLKKAHRKTLLIMLTNAEIERCRITINRVEPDKILLMCSSEAECNENCRQQKNCINASMLSGYTHSVLRCHKIGFMDCTKVTNIIESAYEKYNSEYNIIVTAYGSKIQVLGAMIACRKLRNIEIKYASPQVYNTESYSADVGDLFYGFCDMV